MLWKPETVKKKKKSFEFAYFRLIQMFYFPTPFCQKQGSLICLYFALSLKGRMCPKYRLIFLTKRKVFAQQLTYSKLLKHFFLNFRPYPVVIIIYIRVAIVSVLLIMHGMQVVVGTIVSASNCSHVDLCLDKMRKQCRSHSVEYVSGKCHPLFVSDYKIFGHTHGEAFTH